MEWVGLLREKVSLLLANGHQDARYYPVGMVMDEVELVNRRFNQAEASRAVLLQLAVSSILSKEAGEEFSKIIAKLTKE